MVLFLRSIKSFRYIPENESEQPVLGWNTSEAGPGVAEVLVSGPEGSDVRPHKARKRIEGGAR